MAIDPSISLQVGRGVPQIDVAGAATQAMNLRALAQQAQMQDLALQQQQRQAADQQALRGAYVVDAAGNVDRGATLRNLSRVNPQMAQEFAFKSRQDELATMKAQREAQKAQLESFGKDLEIKGQILGALTDNATPEQVRAAVRLYRMAGGIDPSWDEKEIPDDPVLLPQLIQYNRRLNKDQQAAYWERTRPQSETGKLLADQNRWFDENAQYAQGGSVTDGVSTTVRAPASPFAQELLRRRYGDPEPGFRWDEAGNAVPIQNVLDQRIAERAAGAARNTVNLGQEREEGKTVGKGMGELYLGLQQSARDSRSKIAKLDRMNQLLEGVNTGRLTPLGVELASFAQSLGIQVDPKLGNKEAAEAIANEFALELRNPSGGAGMPGALSDQDRKFLQSMTPGLSKTTQGRKLITESYKKIAQRNDEVARLARRYREKYGMLDEGFEDELAKFSESNSLFPTREEIDAELARRKGKK